MEKVEKEPVLSEQETHSEESTAHEEQAVVEETDDGKQEKILVVGDNGSSVDVEADGGTQGEEVPT